MKDTGIVIGWIAGILLIGWLLFFFTQPLRGEALLRVANNALHSEEGQPLNELGQPLTGVRSGLGVWYTVNGAQNGEKRALVFPIMNEGISVPCAAFVSESGNVEIVPLNTHAKAVLEHLPHGVIELYTRRIAKELQ